MDPSQVRLLLSHEGNSENPLVFEHIILHFQVQAVTRVMVSLLRFMVSSEQVVQDSHPLHPSYLLGHSCTGSTLPLTYKEGESGPL